MAFIPYNSTTSNSGTTSSFVPYDPNANTKLMAAQRDFQTAQEEAQKPQSAGLLETLKALPSAALQVGQGMLTHPIQTGQSIVGGLLDVGPTIVNSLNNLGNAIPGAVNGKYVNPANNSPLPLPGQTMNNYIGNNSDMQNAIRQSSTTVGGYELGGGAVKKALSLDSASLVAKFASEHGMIPEEATKLLSENPNLAKKVLALTGQQRVTSGLLGNVLGGQATSQATTLGERTKQAGLDAAMALAGEGLNTGLGEVFKPADTSFLNTFNEFKGMKEGQLVTKPQEIISTSFKVPDEVKGVIGASSNDVNFTRLSLKHLAEKGEEGTRLLQIIPDILKNPDEVRRGTAQNRFLVTKTIQDEKLGKPHAVSLEVTKKDGSIIVTAFGSNDPYLSKFDPLWKAAPLPSQHLPLTGEGGSNGFSALRESQIPQESPKPILANPVEKSMKGVNSEKPLLPKPEPKIDERLAPLTDEKGMITVYRAAPNFPTDTFAKDTHFATDPKNARYYAESHYTGNPSDITIRQVQVPADLLKRGGSSDSWQIKKDYPVKEPILQTKTSGIAKDIQTKAIENNLTENFKDLATYEPRTIKEQAQKISDLITKNPDDLGAIVRGEKPVPEGMSPSYLVTAADRYATETGNAGLLQDLASSKLTGEGSQHASELRMLGERDQSSAMQALKEIQKAREEKAGRSGGNIKTEVEKIKSNIPKIPKETWASFVDSVTC